MTSPSNGLSRASPQVSADAATRDSGDSPNRPTDVDVSTSETNPLLGDARAPTDPLERRIRGQTADERSRSKIYAWSMLILFGLVFLGISAIYPMASVVSQEYARDALSYQLRNVSIHELTQSGVRLEVRSVFSLNASRVESPMIRLFGRFGTSMMKNVETYGVSEIKLYAPTYDNSFLATVHIPSIKADIRNHHLNEVNFIANVTAHETSSLKNIANDYINDNIHSMTVKSVADFSLISGFLSLGSHQVTGSHHFKG